MFFEDTSSVRGTHKAITLCTFFLGPFENLLGLRLNFFFCQVVLAMIFRNVDVGAHGISGFSGIE
jgi:hypothetical protein